MPSEKDEETVIYMRRATLHRVRRVTARERVETRNGPVYADPGDFIVWDTSGAPYPCSADVFAATYEPVPASAMRGAFYVGPDTSIRDNVVKGPTTLKAGDLEVTVPEPAAPPPGVDGSIHRVRRAVADFYGADEAEPPPGVLEARERELDRALRAWASVGMPS